MTNRQTRDLVLTTNILAARCQLGTRGVIRTNHGTGIIFIVFLTGVWLAVPIISAAGGNNPAIPVTTPDLNVSGTTYINGTLPARYAVTPAPIRIGVRLSETLLSAAKGEMAAGPRSIGFSIDPSVLTLAVIIVTGVSAVLWYLVRRRPDGPERGE
jgi:hypothetical protein